MSAFNRKASLKQCLFPVKDNCSKKIIHAHTIQNNRYLSKIVSGYKGENVLIQVKDLGIDKDGIIIKYQGRNKATTFRGFCSYHDKKLFENIEDQDFQYNREQIFLFAYRAICSTLHSGQEWIKGHKEYTEQEKFFNDENAYYGVLFGMIKELQVVLKAKRKLDYCMKMKKYDILHSCVFKFPNKVISVACSGIVATAFSFDGSSFGNSIESKADLFLTILPDKKDSFAIVSCMTGDQSGRNFIDNLLTKQRGYIELVLSSLAFFYTDSTVLSPKLWNDKLNDSERETLVRMKSQYQSIVSRTDTERGNIKFCMSPINLFK